MWLWLEAIYLVYMVCHLQVIHQGSLTGMKQGREDVELARKDTECGVSFSKDPGFKEGDKIICLNRKRVLPKLNWDLGF